MSTAYQPLSSEGMAGQAPPMAAAPAPGSAPVYQGYQQYQQPPPQPHTAGPAYAGYPGNAPQNRAAPTVYVQPVYQAIPVGSTGLPPEFGPCAGVGHMITEEFTCLGVFLGIVFFPIGLICCLTMKERRCVNCGTRFS